MPPRPPAGATPWAERNAEECGGREIDGVDGLKASLCLVLVVLLQVQPVNQSQPTAGLTSPSCCEPSDSRCRLPIITRGGVQRISLPLWLLFPARQRDGCGWRWTPGLWQRTGQGPWCRCWHSGSVLGEKRGLTLFISCRSGIKSAWVGHGKAGTTSGCDCQHPRWAAWALQAKPALALCMAAVYF